MFDVWSEVESDRIRREYERRDREIPPQRYSLMDPANLFFQHGREREFRRALVAAGRESLEGRRVLEVGFGRGQWFSTLESFGAQRELLAGIELSEERAMAALKRFPGADLRCGNAAVLPWPAGEFDIVLQSMLMSSVLDDRVRALVADEMLRVLQPSGLILWYDFHCDNPGNPNVRGVRKREIGMLFRTCRVRVRRTTLAPPIARAVVRWTWDGASALQALRVFNTHYLGTVRRMAR